MQVSATDADIRSNAEITYTLFGPGAEKFNLNPDTGNDGVWGRINCAPTKPYTWVVVDHSQNLKFRFVHVTCTWLLQNCHLLETENSNLMGKIWGEIKSQQPRIQSRFLSPLKIKENLKMLKCILSFHCLHFIFSLLS